MISYQLFTTGICYLLFTIGISWINLHVLDHNNYWVEPRHDYIPLPVAARTNSTRIRWWQPLGESAKSWTLDDVYIGGAEINPSDVFESFEDETMSDNKLEFYPAGHLDSHMCGKQDNVLAWNTDSGMKMATTRQMIVQDDYMIQFKVGGLQCRRLIGM